MHSEVSETRTWPYWILGILLVSASVFFIVQKSPFGPGGGNAEIAISQKPIERTEVDQNALPKYFPANIPLESKTEFVVDNYTITTLQGQVQSGRKFSSEKTLAANQAIYLKYFSDYGWTVTTNVNEKEFKLISAFKGSLTSSVSITPSVENESTVEIVASLRK